MDRVEKKTRHDVLKDPVTNTEIDIEVFMYSKTRRMMKSLLKKVSKKLQTQLSELDKRLSHTAEKKSELKKESSSEEDFIEVIPPLPSSSLKNLVCLARHVHKSLTKNWLEVSRKAVQAKMPKNVRSTYNSPVIETLLKDAGEGNFFAQNKLGDFFREGYFVKKDYVKARQWYLKAGTQGYPEAQNNLGAMYLTGVGIEKNYCAAAFWFRKASELGFLKAQFHLARLYRAGLGVEKDLEQSIHWCRKAAEAGFPDAQSMLGDFYRDGKGVQVSIEEAINWYEMASLQGHTASQKKLGLIYACFCKKTEDAKTVLNLFETKRSEISAVRIFKRTIPSAKGAGIRDFSTTFEDTEIKQAS